MSPVPAKVETLLWETLRMSEEGHFPRNVGITLHEMGWLFLVQARDGEASENLNKALALLKASPSAIETCRPRAPVTASSAT
jgi:hypothetical protein